MLRKRILLCTGHTVTPLQSQTHLSFTEGGKNREAQIFTESLKIPWILQQFQLTPAKLSGDSHDSLNTYIRDAERKK